MPLTASAITPEAIGVMSARTGQAIVRIPLGPEMMRRYGAPYLVLHRADLQKALLDRVLQTPDIDLRLGLQVEDAAVDPHGVAATLLRDGQRMEETGIALIGADGVWSSVRNRLLVTRPRNSPAKSPGAARSTPPACPMPSARSACSYGSERRRIL